VRRVNTQPEDQLPRYRFGTFELDVRSGELRKQGLLLRLQGQPLQILLALLERPGTIVTREELRQRLWGEETFVDFEHSLNTAIKRLREALNDTASTPRFVETVPRRGYRFIAPVEQLVPPPAAAAMPATASDPAAAPPAPVAGAAIPAPATIASAGQAAAPVAAAAVAPPPAQAAGAVAVARSDAPARGRGARWMLATAAAFAIAVAGVLVMWIAALRQPSVAAGGPGASLRLAVLSFQNLTGDSDRGYIADGFTEELVSQLGRLAPGRLGVIARSSSASFSATAPLGDVVHALGVDYVLEGSVRSTRTDAGTGDRYRIAVRLIRARDMSTIWSELYEGALLDLITAQRDVGQQVARHLTLALLPDDPAALARATTGSSQAYESYLRGLAELARGPGEGFVHAVDLFNRAIAADPGYALAHAALAESYIIQQDYYVLSPEQAQPAAKAAALRALTIDDGLAEAHCALADVSSRSGDNLSADREFARALALNPSRAMTQLRYASHLVRTGHIPDARERLEHARSLAPRSADVLSELAYIDLDARRLDSADALATEALRYQPEYPFALYIRGHVALRRDTPQDAIAQFTRARVASGRAPKYVAALAQAYIAASRQDDAAQAIDELRALSRNRYVPAGWIDDLSGRLTARRND
jgi:TolB-like protein/DNA-binding winged helix-turn-helix (wHTH) protein/Tfp pilus assembly protein PilF